MSDDYGMAGGPLPKYKLIAPAQEYFTIITISSLHQGLRRRPTTYTGHTTLTGKVAYVQTLADAKIAWLQQHGTAHEGFAVDYYYREKL